MEGKHTFLVEHDPTYGSITVEIDFDFVMDFGKGPVGMEAMIKEMVEFWSEYKARLNDNAGDYLKTFLKQLCQRCLIVAVEGNYNENGVISKFKDEEGWLPIDGSNGIELLSIDLPDFGVQDDYAITDITR